MATRDQLCCKCRCLLFSLVCYFNLLWICLKVVQKNPQQIEKADKVKADNLLMTLHLRATGRHFP